MRNTLTFITLTVIALGAVGSGYAADPPRTEGVVVGCLQRSGAKTYLVKDHRSGMSFDVHSQNKTPGTTLDWQVGHELEIHGTFGPRVEPAPQRLNVSLVIEIAPRCPAAPPPKR
jgi:hypothetical protein